MMSNALVLFALSATLASASVVPQPAAARGIIPLIPIFTACINENLDDCTSWSNIGYGSACQTLDEPFNNGGLDLTNTVSSVGTLNPRTVCTIFTSTSCTGKSLVVDGTINALSAFNFDNIANSFSCADSEQ